VFLTKVWEDQGGDRWFDRRSERKILLRLRASAARTKRRVRGLGLEVRFSVSAVELA
jgi:hypothetical protein